MISRRGFFGMLAGLVVCPKNTTNFGQKSLYGGSIPGYNYRFHYKNFIQDDLVSSGNMKYYQRDPDWKEHMNTVHIWKPAPSTLYWSTKEE